MSQVSNMTKRHYTFCAYLMNKTFALFVALSLSQVAQGATYYFGLVGSDGADCTGGTSGAPWRSVTAKNDAGCIGAGDTAIILDGVYPENDAIFVNGRINASGAAGSPLTIKAQNQYGAVFEGLLNINGSYLVIDGLEVRSASTNALMGISAITGLEIKNSKIHGSVNPFVPGETGTGDCVKAADNTGAPTDITLKNNIIYDCAQDAIDLNGVVGATIVGNEVYDSAIIQFKGGTTNVFFSGNNLHDMWQGVHGNGMDCSVDLGSYCGNFDLIGIPVEDRFEADNVQILDNQFTSIGTVSIDASGWHNTKIIGNTFTSPIASVYSLLRLRDTIGTAYYDNVARDYCAANAAECGPCADAGNANCQVVYLWSQNLYIAGNFSVTDNDVFIDFQGDSKTEGTGLCIYNNSFTWSWPQWRINTVKTALEQSPTDCDPSKTIGN